MSPSRSFIVSLFAACRVAIVIHLAGPGLHPRLSSHMRTELGTVGKLTQRQSCGAMCSIRPGQEAPPAVTTNLDTCGVQGGSIEMLKASRYLVAVLAIALPVAGCASEGVDSRTEPKQVDAVDVDEALPANHGWRVRLPMQGESEVVRLVSEVGRTLVAEGSPSDAFISGSSEIESRRVELTVNAEEGVFAVYESLNDSLEVFASVGNRGVRPAETILKDAARAIFEEVFRKLVDRGVIRPDRAEVRRAELHEVHAAEGTEEGVLRQWVDEYAFFVPLKVDGIEVGTLNRRFGVWINVHRSGKIRRVELTGLGLLSPDGFGIIRLPATRGTVPEPNVTKFVADAIGEARLYDLGVRLLLPRNVSDFDEEILPHRLFSVVPKISGPGVEQTLNGKAMVASYALGDSANTLTISPPPKSYPGGIDQGETRK